MGIIVKYLIQHILLLFKTLFVFPNNNVYNYFMNGLNMVLELKCVLTVSGIETDFTF